MDGLDLEEDGPVGCSGSSNGGLGGGRARRLRGGVRRLREGDGRGGRGEHCGEGSTQVCLRVNEAGQVVRGDM